MKYHIITYGCQLNHSNSERIATVLEKEGYEKSQKIDNSDLIAVNMCSIRQSAVDRVYGLIPKFKDLKKGNKNLKIILTGCILKKDKKNFAQYFDYISDSKEFSEQVKNFFSVKPKYSSFPVANVPISTGCDNFCSYCVVPYTRGRENCRPAEKIISEVKHLVKKNFKEIWLLGENVNSYKSKIQMPKDKFGTKPEFQEINFSGLLSLIGNIPGDFWIRFTSSNPKDFSDELIRIMAKSKKITPYLNLPIQSGSNKILEAMKRRYKVNDYLKLVKKIKRAVPDIALSTDIIVGFPGETKRHFRKTARLFKKVKFDMAYISQYSPRPMTAAFKMKDNISQKEKRRRDKVLTKILAQNNQKKNNKLVGKEIKVLAIKDKDNFILGKSPQYKTIKFKGERELIGSFHQVKIIKSYPWGLGGLIANLDKNEKEEIR